jgi:hypothetical protein
VPLPPVNRDDPASYEHYTLSLLGRMSSLVNVGESYRQLMSSDTIGRLRVCAVLLRDSCNAQERASGMPSDMSALYSSLRQLAGSIVGGGMASLASLAAPAAAAQAQGGSAADTTATNSNANTTTATTSSEARRSDRRRGRSGTARGSRRSTNAGGSGSTSGRGSTSGSRSPRGGSVSAASMSGSDADA